MINNIKLYISKIAIICFSILAFSNNVIAQELTEERPYYTSVDKIVLIEKGMTYDKVLDVLKSQPNKLLSFSESKGMIYQFKYLLKSKRYKNTEDTFVYDNYLAQKDHYKEEKSLYVFFNKDKELEKYYTDIGQARSNDVLNWENTLNSLNEKNTDCVDCKIVAPEIAE